MTEIAVRSKTSIGGLYHYFPDKQAIAVALLDRYRQELETEWRRLMEQAGPLNHEQFAELLLDGFIRFTEDRPAYLKLATDRIRGPRNPEARLMLRRLLASAFRSKKPSLSEAAAMRAAKVTVEIVKGLRSAYLDAVGEEKPLVSAEFKRVLTFYLGSILQNP
jgi:AcrR family transcriptional regulator